MIKGVKSIAEYAIRKWILEQNFVMEFFKLYMQGNKGILKDNTGESITLIYDTDSKSVYIED